MENFVKEIAFEAERCNECPGYRDDTLIYTDRFAQLPPCWDHNCGT